MPWKVQDTSTLIKEYGTVEGALNAAEQEGWSLRFIRPGWSQSIGKQHVSVDETLVFHKDD